MQLTLANHPISDIRFDTRARLDGTMLCVDPAALRDLVLTDDAMVDVEFEIVHPGELCRAGPIFDVVEPRAKAPGAGDRFSRHLRARRNCGTRHDTCAHRRRRFSACGNFTRPDTKRHGARVGDERRAGGSQ